MPALNNKEAFIYLSQKKEILKRLKDLQKNPSKVISWNEASKKIKRLAK
jgi:hypothetical protein